MSFPRFLKSVPVQDYPPAKGAKSANPRASGAPKLATLAGLAAVQSRSGPPEQPISAEPSAYPAAALIEATFKPTVKVMRPPMQQKVTPVNPEFPPCPKCGAVRYWISRGKVLCGSRTCYSAVRFILTSIEYYPVQ